MSRLTGVTFLACVHKPVGATESGRAARLDECEIAVVSRDPALELDEGFLRAAQGSDFYACPPGPHPRAYAWAAWTGPVPVMSGFAVDVPEHAVYVYKAFTDPAYRGRGYLGECLKAIEHAAAERKRRTVMALIEVHNRSSRRAFRRAGFTRCGLVCLVGRASWSGTSGAGASVRLNLGRRRGLCDGDSRT
jgi:GNAT superfamily N-acetyltransferase